MSRNLTCFLVKTSLRQVRKSAYLSSKRSSGFAGDWFVLKLLHKLLQHRSNLFELDPKVFGQWIPREKIDGKVDLDVRQIVE